MKRYWFECRKVVEGCEGKVHGKTPEEAFEAAKRHAAEAHGIQDLDLGTTELIRAGIVEER